ncbi:MAG: hypothetical protein U0V87_16885 [Acidobacteriota bacterium]
MRTRGGELREGDVHRLRGHVARQRATWIVMTITEDVLSRAARGFPIEPVRTLDALHLATALAFTAVFPDLEILSLDRRITDNARALGL